MHFGDKLLRKLKFSITEAPVKLKSTDQNTNFFAAADKVDLQISNHLKTIHIGQEEGTNAWLKTHMCQWLEHEE